MQNKSWDTFGLSAYTQNVTQLPGRECALEWLTLMRKCGPNRSRKATQTNRELWPSYSSEKLWSSSQALHLVAELLLDPWLVSGDITIMHCICMQDAKGKVGCWEKFSTSGIASCLSDLLISWAARVWSWLSLISLGSWVQWRNTLQGTHPWWSWSLVTLPEAASSPRTCYLQSQDARWRPETSLELCRSSTTYLLIVSVQKEV